MDKHLKKKKKKFRGNRYTVADDATKSRVYIKASKMPINCPSKRKLNQLPNETVAFSDLVVCPDCGKNKLHNNLEMGMGFIYELNLACEACNWNYRGYTSKYVEKEVITGFPRQI